MRKTSASLLLIFIISIFPMQTFAASAVPSSATLARFTFSEISYGSEMFDANELSQDLFRVCGKDHKSGYIDKDGNVAIDFDFAYSGSFHNSLAPANVPYGKLGYIDKTGKFAIEPQFDMANEFSCGLALVRKSGKTGFIDSTGKFADIIKNDAYTPVSSFNDGVCWVENADEKRAIISSDGTLVTDFDFVWSGEWTDGVCWASKDMGSDFNHISMGLIDTTGKFIIEPGIYTDGGTFSEGVCWVKKIDSNKIYLIDKEGNEVAIIADGLMPSNFSNGVCVNVGGDLLSVMNTKGITIWSSKTYLPVHYGGFCEGKMLVKRQSDGKYFIMCDTQYVAPSEQETMISGYNYEATNLKDNNFEIALRIDLSTALVNDIKTAIDESDSRVCAFVENGRTLLPMRFIAENLPGYSVTWDYISSSALVQNDYTSILLKADTPSAEMIRYIPEARFYEQNTRTLDQPAINAYDRLFLPVRALCEMIGVKVFYDERGIVVISNRRNSLDYDAASEILDKLAE